MKIGSNQQDINQFRRDTGIGLHYLIIEDLNSQKSCLACSGGPAAWHQAHKFAGQTRHQGIYTRTADKMQSEIVFIDII